MYIQNHHTFPIHPDKLFETIDYLNECFNENGGEVTIEFSLPLKKHKNYIHFITIRGTPPLIHKFLTDEFLKKQKEETHDSID